MANKNYQLVNETKHVLPQCKVVVYPWAQVLNNPNLEDKKLAEAGRLDISSRVKTVTYSKNMGSAAGSFSIELENSPGIGTNDWKDILKRGYWVVIYMSNEGDLILNSQVGENLAVNKKQEAKRIRCIGYIEKVGVSGNVQENRAIDVTFSVTGRDFGIIYEQTDIWHNLFNFDKLILDSIAQTKLNVTGNVRIHEALKLIHDLFYYPLNIRNIKVNDNKSLLSIGLQWLLPKEMLSDIGFSLSALAKGTYWGALPEVFQTKSTGAGIAVDKPGDYLSGNAWEQLKRLSIPQLHELFCETQDDGKPRLVFRPIPWGINQSKYPNNAQFITLYKDITDIVNVPAVDLITFEMSEDDYARYNSFLVTVSTGLINTEDNISLLLGKGYPKFNFASIKRHGFRPMHVAVDSIVKNEALANGSADLIQLKEYNEVMYDYWNNAVFAETGDVVKIGSNDVKVGKVMKFNNDIPYLSTKRYYIEGYTDTFTVGDKREREWTQVVNLTRGFEEADLVSRSGFANRNTDFTAPGDFTDGEGNN